MNKKLVIWIACITVLLSALPAHGQDADNQEKIKSLKVAFFTEQLGLTANEASVFWPLYNTYEKEKEALRDRQRREVYERVGSGDYSESEARSILERHHQLELQQEEIDRRFNLKIAETFSATRTLKLFRAEHEFRKRLIREFRNRNGSNEP